MIERIIECGPVFLNISTAKKKSAYKIGDDLKLFLIMFSVALLFIIRSASAMRYFDGQSVKKKNKDE